MRKIEKKILITGASGRLGQEFKRQVHVDDLILKPRESLDLTDSQLVQECIAAVRPDVVINTAAVTGAKASSPDLLWKTNVIGASNLVDACASNGVPIIHVSTGDVLGGFYSPGPFAECHPTQALSPYLQSRAAGEHAILQAVQCNLKAFQTGFRYWIVRSSMLYASSRQFSGGFVHDLIRKAMLGQKEVPIANDVFRSPTYLPHFVQQLMWLVDNRRDIPSGLYHVAGAGSASLYDIASFVLARLQTSMTFRACDHAEQASSMGVSWMSLAKSAALDSGKWNKFCRTSMPDWRESMEEFLLGGSGFAK